MNVEDQLRAAITRQADSYAVPLPDIDRFATGAMRRRRRHRVVAALAACAVIGIMASGIVTQRTWWDTGGAGPADQPTSPTQESTTSSSTDDRVGIVGPPPPGTPPTGPAAGELVAAASLYRSGTWVYADGRIISVVRNKTSDEFRGFVVRQLTPSGVEAMRSFLLDGTSGLDPVAKRDFPLIVRDAGRLMFARHFNGCRQDLWNLDRCPGFSEPEQWLPASAWDDPTFRPFVPHAYQICLSHKDLAVLPAEAADMFLASPVHGYGPDTGDCRAVATSDARTLVDTLEEAGAVRGNDGNNLRLDLRSLGGDGLVVFNLILPDGSTYCDCG